MAYGRAKWKEYKNFVNLYSGQKPTINGFKEWLKDNDAAPENVLTMPALNYPLTSDNISNSSSPIPKTIGKPAFIEIALNRPKAEQLQQLNDATLAECRLLTNEQLVNESRKSYNRAALAYYTAALEQERYRTIREVIQARGTRMPLPLIPVTHESRNSFARNTELIAREIEREQKKVNAKRERELKDTGKVEALLALLKKR